MVWFSFSLLRFEKTLYVFNILISIALILSLLFGIIAATQGQMAGAMIFIFSALSGYISKTLILGLLNTLIVIAKQTQPPARQKANDVTDVLDADPSIKTD